MAVAVVGGRGQFVGHEVTAGCETTAVVGVGGDAGVDDVGGDAAARGSVGVGAVQWQADLIAAVHTPRWVQLGVVQGDDGIVVHPGDTGHGLHLGELAFGENREVAVEGEVVGGEDVGAQCGHDRIAFVSGCIVGVTDEIAVRNGGAGRPIGQFAEVTGARQGCGIGGITGDHIVVEAHSTVDFN